MGVIDGQPVSAAVTNPAFLDADSDDTALGKLSLNNISDPTNSGSAVNNIQREFNAISAFTGKPTNVAKDYTPPWINNQVGTPTDTLFVRSNLITGLFDGTLGHTHDGTNGNGPVIPAANLGNFPFAGYFSQGTQLTLVTGSSTDVSTELTGKAPSTGPTALGVVVNAPYNKVILRDTNGDSFVDGSGNTVYARLTESSGVWTLSYYVLIGGTETAYSFLLATTVDWYYQELFAPNVSTPVYSEIAITPSDNTTADVIDATETVAGKVILANTAPPAVAAASAKGTNTRVAHQDHTHEGVHSILIDGDVTVGLGDVTLKSGANVTLAWVSGKVEISASSQTPQVEYRTITSGEATAKQLTLAFTPNVAANVMLDVVGGTAQISSVDYSVSGAVLTWNGLGLDSLLAAGDVLRIHYWT